MSNMPLTLSEQISRLVTENQNLRVKSSNDDTTFALMKSQYDGLAESVDAMRDKYERQIQKLTVERDHAVRAFKEIDTTLLQSADLIMQALRARNGDDTPEIVADRKIAHINDDRLPIARLS